MTRNNRKPKQKNGPRNRTQQVRRRATNEDVLIRQPLMSLMYNPTNPGRAVMRGAVEMFNGAAEYKISYKSFEGWCNPARSLLVPFQYFRVTDVVVRPRVAGGAASAYSLAYNVSNNVIADTSTTAILDDDYAAVANAMVQPVLRPPQRYWQEGARTWYTAVDPTNPTPPVPATPLPQELVAGTISAFGSGGDEPTTVIGWMIIEFVLEFHTLV